MDKILINQLELVYAPLSNYDLTILKDDEWINAALRMSEIYIITQRLELHFSNIHFSEAHDHLNFEITQTNNTNSLRCSLPLIQPNLLSNINNYHIISFANRRHRDHVDLPSSRFDEITIHTGTEVIQDNFLVWFTPEKFLFNLWRGSIRATIEGDETLFTRYKVHYVGQSTKQGGGKRTKSHSTLQEILSLAEPFSNNSLPTHEIVLLFFGFKENLQMSTLDESDSPNDIEKIFNGKDLPRQGSIFLDAEKALIKVMQPKYNGIMFAAYPKSSDGLYPHNYISITYTFTDPITFVYDNGEIRGGTNVLGGDFIVVKEGKTVELIKT